MSESGFKVGWLQSPICCSASVSGNHEPLRKGRGCGRVDDLPGELVSFDFLLTGFLESPLSLSLDTQDTSVFVPGDKEHKIFKRETMIC